MSSSTDSPLSSTTQESTSPQQPEPPKSTDKINPLDLNSVKCAIDDQVVKSLEYSGEFHENHTLTNIKIILGLIAVSGAVYAYFEEHVLLTASLCALYIIISIIMQLLGWFVQGNAFFVSAVYKGQVVRATGYIKDAYSTTYVLVLESFASQGGMLKNFSYHASPESNKKHNYIKEEIEMEITTIFDAQGNMEKIAVAKHVDGFVELVQGQTLKKE